MTDRKTPSIGPKPTTGKTAPKPSTDIGAEAKIENASASVTTLLKSLSNMPNAAREQMAIERLRENLPSDEALSAMSELLAKTRWAMYQAHLKAGFSEAQALLLCQNK